MVPPSLIIHSLYLSLLNNTSCATMVGTKSPYKDTIGQQSSFKKSPHLSQKDPEYSSPSLNTFLQLNEPQKKEANSAKGRLLCLWSSPFSVSLAHCFNNKLTFTLNSILGQI